MRLNWLADVLRAAGLKVVEEGAWEQRGLAYESSLLGVVIHETQGATNSTERGEINVLINGRVGLSGPIAQLFLGKDGTWHAIASGRCNQVKTGWAGPMTGYGNSRSFGIEAHHSVSEDWADKPVQYNSYVRGVAAICNHLGWDPDSKVIGHKEHQPGDKSDPEFNMNRFRADVKAVMEGDDMPILTERLTDKNTDGSNAGYDGASVNWALVLLLRRTDYIANTSKLVARLERIEAAALDDGNVNVVLDPDSLAEFQAVRAELAALAATVNALPGAVVTEQAQRLAE